MKKDFLKFVFAAVFALAAGYSVFVSQQKVEMSDLAMANIEALAQGETSEEFTDRTCCEAVWENSSCSGCDGHSYSYAIRK